MKNTKPIRKVLALILTTVMVFGSFGGTGIFAAADGVKTNGSVSWEKVDNSLYPTASPINPAEEVEEEPEYQDTDVVRVSIVLEEPSTIDAGFKIQGIAKNAKAMAYREKLQAKQDEMASTISKKVLNGKALDVYYNITLAANIISADVEYGKIAEIEALPGVKEVFVEQFFYMTDTEAEVSPNMGPSSGMIGSPSAWAEGYTGAGSKVAIIDTGIADDHQSFNEKAYLHAMEENADAAGMSLDEYSESVGVLTKENIAAIWNQLNASNFGKNVTLEDSWKSAKIPFCINYTDKNLTTDHTHDTQSEHGSHVSGIAAANRYIANDDDTFSNALDAVFTQGVAPDAQIVAMKVFGRNGASEAAYMPAIEDAILLGCDSANLSLGSPLGGSFSSRYESVMNKITESGMIVSISAGNSDAWAYKTETGNLYSDGVSFDTAGSPGTYNNSLCVASIDNNGATGMPMKFGSFNCFYTETSYSNPPISKTIPGDQEYIMFDSPAVDADNVNLLKEYEDVIKGKIVLVYRGTSSFYLKMEAVAELGGAACVIVNNQPGSISMNLGSTSVVLPCVSITQSDGEKIKALSTWNEEGQYWTGSVYVTEAVGSEVFDNEYYTMSDFSSWGVPGALKMKPEITAPGGSIYSVHGTHTEDGTTMLGGPTQYELMSGTSMAAPQIAGMAGVFGQYYRENGLEELGVSQRALGTSLLMSTADPVMQKDSQYYYSILKQGAGLAQIGKAVAARTYIMMGEDATESYADGKVKVELGDDPDRVGKYSFGFTVNNMEDVEKYFNLRADFFTQDIFTEDGIDYLSQTTTPVAATVTWTVDGNEVEPTSDPAIVSCDFDGDGVVDENDGQAILDYVTTVIDSISNEEYADLDGDGDIDTYDAYLFFCMLGTSAVILPAGGSIDVVCKVTLKDISNFDVDGAYVEGFVFAEELTSEEGVLGDVHSIPVLGYYGSWTDPSMFDIGSYIDYKTGAETRNPYLQAANTNAKTANNILIVRYNGSKTNTNFGGNQIVPDTTYMQERDALSTTNSTNIYQFKLSTIRTSTKGRVSITDDAGNEYYASEGSGMTVAYYNDNNSAWTGLSSNRSINKVLADIPDGTKASVNVTIVPEYYSYNGKAVDWSSVGKGATKSASFIVDGTAPELKSAMIVKNDDGSRDLTVTVSDNQYVAGIVLLNSAKKEIARVGSNQEKVDAGTDYTVTIPMGTESSVTAQVYDYAYNLSTYTITDATPVPTGEEAPAEATEAPAEEVAEEVVEEIVEEVVEEAAEAPAAAEAPVNTIVGGLNSIHVNSGSGAVQPNGTGSTVGSVVTLTAVDENGDEIDTTNGLMEVTWDPAVVELTGYKVFAQYKSVKAEDGKIIIGYVDTDGIAAGEDVAELTFTVKDHPAVAEVTYKEASDAEIDYTEVICLFDHMSTVTVDAKDPTCTEDGYTGDIYCEDCGELLEEGTVIPATGHTWGEWTETKAPTCTEEGEETRECSVCHEKETRPVDKVAHVEGNVVIENTVAPTCTEDGSHDEVTYCDECGEELSRETVVDPATGHGEPEVKDAKEATCTEDGYTGDKVCPTCGEVLEKGEVIPAAGHNFDTEKPEYTWNEDKTECTVSFTCTECGEKDEHECTVTEEVVTEATETEPGLKKVTATFTDKDGKVYTAVVEVVIPVKTSPVTGIAISGIGIVGALGAAAYVFGRKREEDEE